MASAFRCPACRAEFPEPGFCPHDGTPLRPDSGVDDGSPTMVAQPRTAPKPAADFGSVPPSGMYRSFSAAENTAEAVAAFHANAQLRTEYDRLIGQTLDGRYLIERKLGEGGMGVVFAARHAVIERPLAIKVLKREVMRDAATIKRFVQEAKAASRIGHPNIIDVTDFGTTPDGMTYQVMEYVDGKTLGAMIKATAPMKPSRVVRIAAQIARALGAAHDKGIVHRDLKPDNIFLVDRDGRRDFVKIVDFGIAKVTPLDGEVSDGPRLTRAGAVFGTPEYMAPEQAAGRGDTDGRVDVYALGIIMYEMLVGKVPHKGDTMVRTLAMQMLDTPIPPRTARPELDIPAALEAVVLRALTKKREQRYATMGALLTDLETVAGASLSEPVSAAASLVPERVFTLAPLPPGADAARVRSARPSMPLLDGRSRRPSDGPSTGDGVSTPRSRGGDSGHHPVATPVGGPSTGDGPRLPARVTAPTPVVASTTAQIAAVAAERSGRPMKHEPRFVTNPRAVLAIDPSEHDDPVRAEPPRRWPWVLVAGVFAAALGAMIALTMRGPKGEVALPVAVAATPDARPAPPVPFDAAPIIPIGPDANVPFDGRRRPNPPPSRDARPSDPPSRDAAPRLSDFDRSLPPGERGAIKIVTNPEGGYVYTDRTYRGLSGVTVQADPGTKAHVVCEMSGYESGELDVTWSIKYQELVCVMKRIKRCIDKIRNPYDDCP